MNHLNIFIVAPIVQHWQTVKSMELPMFKMQYGKQYYMALV